MNCMRFLNQLLIVGVLLQFSTSSVAASLSQLDNQWPIQLSHEAQHNYSGQSAFLQDNSNKLSIEDALLSESWQQSQVDHLNFGFSDSAYWLAVQFDSSGSLLSWYIRLRYTLFDQITVYICPVQTTGAENCSIKEMGDSVPFNQRDFQYPEFVAMLNFPERDKYWVITRIKTAGSYPLMINVSDTQTITSELLSNSALQGAYIAVMLVMGLYNLFIFFTTKDRSYLYYSAFVISFLLFHMSYTSITFQVFWPNDPSLNSKALPLTYSIILIFLNLFIPKFLDLKNNGHKSFYLFRSYLVLSILILIGNLFIPYQLLLKILNIFMMICVISALTIGIRFWIAGIAAARFFTIAWATFLAGLLLTISRSLGITPLNTFTFSSYQLGSFLEVILLSLALAERITLLQNEKLKSRKELIQSKEALIRSKEEKSKSLKQLIMGVSHEMNTPLGNIKMAESFVREESSNISENNKATILSGLDIIQTGVNHLETLSRLMKSSVTVNENFKKEVIELKSWLETWKNGIEQSFEDIRISINELNIVSKWNTYPNALSEVLTHLVENSIQHNPDLYTKHELHISISYSLQNKELTIYYFDNGTGVEKESRESIFQPFFTTRRQEASNKGLGLYYTYNLVTETLSGNIKWSDNADGFSLVLAFSHNED